MNRYLIGMVALSAYRRRKGLWKVVLLSFLCVLLFGGVYFRYLELGLTRGQLRGMVGFEWAAAFFPAAGVALILSVIRMGIWAGWLSGLFYVSGGSMAMFSPLPLACLRWCFPGFRVRGIHEMTGQMPVKRLRPGFSLHWWRCPSCYT